MSAFRWVPDVKISDILMSLSVMVAFGGFAYNLLKDRQLRSREYADRIRTAASSTVVALERWKELSLGFFEAVQPLITDTDGLLIADQRVVDSRDFFWRGLVQLRADTLHNILNEKVELAYLDLLGYAPAIQQLFENAIACLRIEGDRAFQNYLEGTQADILGMKSVQRPYQSAWLGNRLRGTTVAVQCELSTRLDEVILQFREEVMKLITADDGAIVRKSIRVDPNRIPKPMPLPKGAPWLAGSHPQAEERPVA
jgi:hypothetical protein